MADEPETMAEVRARANSHDGCPTDIFDRALAAHDARVRRDAVEEYKDRQVRIHISPAPTQMVPVPARCPKCGYR